MPKGRRTVVLIRRCAVLLLVLAAAGLLVVSILGSDRPVVGSLRLSPHCRLVGIAFDRQARLFWVHSGEERLLGVSAGLWHPDVRSARGVRRDPLVTAAPDAFQSMKSDTLRGVPALVVTTTACGSTQMADDIQFATVQHRLPLGRFKEVRLFAAWRGRSHSATPHSRVGGEAVVLRYSMVRAPVIMLTIAAIFFPLLALSRSGHRRLEGDLAVPQDGTGQDPSNGGGTAEDGGGTSTRRQ